MVVTVCSGIACTLRCAVTAEIAEGSLVALRLSRGPGPLQVRWAYAESRDVPEIAFAFIGYLNERQPFS